MTLLKKCLVRTCAIFCLFLFKTCSSSQCPRAVLLTGPEDSRMLSWAAEWSRNRKHLSVDFLNLLLEVIFHLCHASNICLKNVFNIQCLFDSITQTTDAVYRAKDTSTPYELVGIHFLFGLIYHSCMIHEAETGFLWWIRHQQTTAPQHRSVLLPDISM